LFLTSVLCGCNGSSSKSNAATFSPTTTTATIATTAFAANAPNYLPIPTYVDNGGNFVVHPNVLDFGTDGFKGHRYWMAISTYPPNDNTREGPSIYVSDDGSNWTMPPGVSNPIEVPDATWTSSDPELFVGPTGQLYCIWRDYQSVNGTDSERLYYEASLDGVKWSDRTLFLETSATSWRVYSPSAMYKDGLFYVWTTNDDNRMELRTGQYLTALSVPTLCSFDHVFEPYHNSVRYFSGRFAAVIQNKGVSELRYAESSDGINWTIGASALLGLGAKGQWDDLWMYRADFAPNGLGGYDLWYSARGSAYPTAFRFGRTTIALNPPLK
jgi:hypothetical protein